MRSPTPLDPLAGSVVSLPTRWPGQLKLTGCADAGHFNLLQQMPGTQPRTGQKHAEEDGWYIPLSLFEMGRRPADLSEYQPDPHDTMPNGLKLREYQQRTVTYLRQVTPDREGAILAADMGLRKAQPLDSRVLTTSGYRQMGDLRVGDNVIDEHGREQSVLAIYPQGRRPVYSVGFSDGTRTGCTMDHLWTVATTNWKKRGQPARTLPLSALADRLHYCNGNRRFYIPVLDSPVEFNRGASLPLHPYLFGILLADGQFTGHTPMLHNPEADIQRRVAHLLPNGLRLVPIRDTDGLSWRISKSDNDGERNEVRVALEELGLWGKYSEEKFVPECYLQASPLERLELLRGMIDGDGEVAADGIATAASTSSERLKIDIVRLVQELGGVAREHVREPHYTYRGEHRTGLPAYRVNVRFPAGVRPVSSEKHLARWHETTKYPPTRGIESVDYREEIECQCIKVSGPSGLYLTDSCIVTHNTASALQALWLDGYLQRCGLVIGPPPAEDTWCAADSDARQFFNLEIIALEGMKNIAPEILQHHKWFFCHYGILKAWYSWLFAVLKPTCLIVDESHWLMNPHAQRVEASRNISTCASIERRYLLTGTPIGNKRLELWCQLAVAQPRQWGTSQFQFGVRYCAGSRQSEEEGGHWQFEGESNDFELGARLAGTLLRYTRFDPDVAAQLPPMKRHAVVAEGLDEKLLADYHSARVNIIKYLQDQGKLSTKAAKLVIGSQTIELSANDQKPGAVRLMCLTHLISILSQLKRAPALLEAVRILGQHDRLVIFTWRIDTAAWLYEKLSALARGSKIAGKQVKVFGPIDGDMPRHERRHRAKLFAQSPAGIYVATRGAAGIAINDLVAASACLMVDLYWNTTTLLQAESRVHRDSTAGSQHANVDVYYLVVRNTIDDFMLEKLQIKANVIRTITPRDTMGMHLVRDLSPSSMSDDGPDMDALCAALMEAA